MVRIFKYRNNKKIETNDILLRVFPYIMKEAWTWHGHLRQQIFLLNRTKFASQIT